MKKFFIAMCAACFTLCANAQKNITVWYGANISNVSFEGNSPDSDFKVLNIGVDYTAPINETFNWTAGLSYQTKGYKAGGESWSPGFIQLEGNGSWNVMNNDNFKLGVFTGPCVNLMIAKDDAKEVKTFGLGWQGGLTANISCISLKAGYEYGLTDLAKGGKSKPSEIFFRIGYNF